MLSLNNTVKMGFLALFILIFSLSNQVQANPLYASIVIDADTGEILHESRADAARYPASLTKMMTLYLLFEAMQQGRKTLESEMKVSSQSASMPQTNINLRSGDTISVSKAIPALIVRSANDVAVVVAEALGGTEDQFGRMMTDKARILGMHSTSFRNASGLPNMEQKTTAKDMVILATRLQKDFPQYYHYFSTQSFHYKGVTYNSHNRMVRNTAGVDGMKTGYIRASGFNIATSAKRGNRRLIAVVMGGKAAASRDQHMNRLLDRAFAQAATNSSHSAKVLSDLNLRASISIPVPKYKPEPILEIMPESKPLLLSENASSQVVTPLLNQSELSVKPQSKTVVNNGKWAVQVGTFMAQESAQARVMAATRWVTGEMVVTEVEIRDQKYYRARLEGLQEDQARAACQNLAQQGIECLVIQ